MNRILKTALKILCAFLFLLIAFFFSPMLITLLIPGYNHDAYRIDNAQFDRTTFGELATREQVRNKTATFPEFGFSYHAIKPGAGTIIAIRSFYDELIVMDEERYAKITIWLPEYKDGTYNLSDSELVAYYSKGGSAWPRNDCSQLIKSGSLTIKDQVVSIQTQFLCTRQHGKAVVNVQLKSLGS